jgi:hypothetical protein
MTTTTPRFLTIAALLAGSFLMTGLLASCGSPDKVTRTTTEHTSTTPSSAYPETSSTTTTTRESRP